MNLNIKIYTGFFYPVTVCILLSLYYATSFAQTKQLDSLKIVLEHLKEDSNKVNILYKVGEEHWNRFDFENTVKYADSALQLARKLKLTSKEFDALMFLGDVNAYKTKTWEANKYFSEAIEISKKSGNKKKIAETFIDIASSYKFALNYENAFKNAFISLKLFEELGNSYSIAQTWLMMGRIYSYQGNFLELKKCCTKALRLFEICPERKREDLGICYHYIGRADLFQGNYRDAMSWLLKALQVWQETGDSSILFGTNYHIGLVYKRLGQNASSNGDEVTAKKMYIECKKRFSSYAPLPGQSDNFLDLAELNQELGDINILLKKFTEARYHLNKSLKYTASTQLIDTYCDIYLSFSKLDSAEGNYKIAYMHYKLSRKYADSVLERNRGIINESYRMQYEFEKKEDSLKQKQLLTETKLHAEKKQRYFYWIGLALLTLLSFFIYLTFRNQKKINKLAAEAYAKEKAELELQSLRAQLNPHFIFNCINSIDAFIHNNDKYNATLYLNKFAKLLRNILDSSRLPTVAFTKDIETLKLYIELEEFRNENKFTTNINIDNELLENDYKVPTLIIQPFVENAILHGLKNKEGNQGLLQIDIKKVEDSIEYSIQDNGIGRKAAGMISQNKQSSHGMQLSYERIRLFNNEAQASVKITDLDSYGESAGTLIKASLKIV